jgi:hypothetical protein
MDLQFKLTTIASIFLAEYGEGINNLQLIDTEMFKDFIENADEVFKGETREMLTSSKNAAHFYLRKLVQTEGLGVRGAMAISFTGDVLIEYQMAPEQMAGAIRILNVSTYMRNLRYLVVSSEITHLVAYKISEGLILCVDGDPSAKLESLVVRISDTVKQIREVIPH